MIEYDAISDIDFHGRPPSSRDNSIESYLLHQKPPEREESHLPIYLYHERIKKVLSIDPLSIEVRIEKKGLYPWEPACCWIEELEDENSSVVYRSYIQFHPSLFSSTRSKYALEPYVIVLHEYVHAIRASLQSPKYEEWIAYLISYHVSSSFCDRVRSILGPIFQSISEIVLFFITFFFLVAISLYSEFIPFSYIMAIPVILLLPFILRLFYYWQKTSRVLKILTKETLSPYRLLIRLEDRDIEYILLHGRWYSKEEMAKDWRLTYLYRRYVKETVSV